MANFRNCQIGEDLKCAQCEKVYSHRRIEIRCAEGGEAVKIVRRKKHRLRTDEEYVAVTHICQACEHFTGELCALKKAGCRACQSAAKFAQWKRSGEQCPDKPPRFAGTPLIE